MRGYGSSTSTGTLRKHLFSYHIEDWLSKCERLQIRITAKDALAAIAAFQGTRTESQTQQSPKFTQERFVNALAEFIVATDQVYSYFFSVLFFCLTSINYL